jgi:hypothetical protein
MTINVLYVDFLGNSLAAANRATKEIYINEIEFPKLTDQEQKFILLHEVGHIVNDSSDEIKADNYAAEQIAKLNSSELIEAINLLKKRLGSENERVFNAVVKKAHLSAHNNGNLKEMDELFRNIDHFEGGITRPTPGQILGLSKYHSNLDHFDPMTLGIAAQGVGSILGGVDNLFNGNKRSNNDRRSAEAMANSQNVQALTSFNISRMNLKNEEDKNQTRLIIAIISILSVVSVVVGLSIYLKNR